MYFYRICHGTSITNSKKPLKFGGASKAFVTMRNRDSKSVLPYLAKISHTLPYSYSYFQGLSKADMGRIKATQLPYIIAGKQCANNNNRKKSNVVYINFVILDIDCLNSMKDLPHSSLQLYSHVRYNTVRSTPEQPRIRLIFPVKPDTYKPAEYPSMVNQVSQALFQGKIKIDPASDLSCQPMIRPIQFTPNDDHFIPQVVDTGLLIDSLYDATLQPVTPAIMPDTTCVEGLEHVTAPRGTTLDDIRGMLSHIDPNLGRSEWIKIMMSIRHETQDNPEEGFEIFDGWSRGLYTDLKSEPDNYGDTRSNWDSVSPNPSSTSIQPRSIGSLIMTAKHHGYKVPDEHVSDVINEEFVYIKSEDTFYSLFDNTEISSKVFNLVQAKNFSQPGNLNKSGNLKRSPTALMLTNGDSKIVHSKVYLPGEPKLVTYEGIECVNTFEPGGDFRKTVPPAEGRELVKTLNRHLEMLWPNKHHHILDYLSYLVQNPKDRVSWFLLLQSKQGAGKSLISTIAQLMFGSKNVKEVVSTSIMSDFNSWAVDTRVVIAEEFKIHGSNRWIIANTLKAFITNKVIAVNEKFSKERNNPNTISMIGFTNLTDAMPLEKGDRRFCVLMSDFDPRSPDSKTRGYTEIYYQQLFESVRENGGYILEFLMSREISKNFNPEGPAPLTEDHERMRQASKLPLEKAIDRLMTTKFSGRDIISPELIYNTLEGRGQLKLDKYSIMSISQYLITEYGFKDSLEHTNKFACDHSIFYSQKASSFNVEHLKQSFSKEYSTFEIQTVI